jgi:hypothetical protein
MGSAFAKRLELSPPKALPRDRHYGFSEINRTIAMPTRPHAEARLLLSLLYLPAGFFYSAL